MLRVHEISAGYGEMEVLRNASMEVKDGEFVSIVGPNGAGKSTLLKAISGTAKCFRGRVDFIDTDITRMASYDRTRLGIIHVPEGRRIFKSLSVAENLDLGAYRKKARGSADHLRLQVFDTFPILKERRNQDAGNLSGGEQQMLAIGRGLMASPRLLMLDEPSLGLSPIMSDFIFDTIKQIHGKLGLAILLVEQRAVEALELCSRGYIFQSGGVGVSGDREDLIGNPIVQKFYFGGA